MVVSSRSVAVDICVLSSVVVPNMNVAVELWSNVWVVLSVKTISDVAVLDSCLSVVVVVSAVAEDSFVVEVSMAVVVGSSAEVSVAVVMSSCVEVSVAVVSCVVVKSAVAVATSSVIVVVSSAGTPNSTVPDCVPIALVVLVKDVDPVVVVVET